MHAASTHGTRSMSCVSASYWLTVSYLIGSKQFIYNVLSLVFQDFHKSIFQIHVFSLENISYMHKYVRDIHKDFKTEIHELRANISELLFILSRFSLPLHKIIMHTGITYANI